MLFLLFIIVLLNDRYVQAEKLKKDDALQVRVLTYLYSLKNKIKITDMARFNNRIFLKKNIREDVDTFVFKHKKDNGYTFIETYFWKKNKNNIFVIPKCDKNTGGLFNLPQTFYLNGEAYTFKNLKYETLVVQRCLN